MLSISRSQIAGQAEEEAREADINFQISGGCSLGTEPTIYGTSLYEDFLTPAVSDDVYPEMLLPVSAFKTESDPFDWETGLEMET